MTNKFDQLKIILEEISDAPGGYKTIRWCANKADECLQLIETIEKSELAKPE